MTPTVIATKKVKEHNCGYMLAQNKTGCTALATNGEAWCMQTPKEGQEASFASVNGDRPGVQGSLGRRMRARAPLQEACVSVSSRLGRGRACDQS